MYDVVKSFPASDNHSSKPSAKFRPQPCTSPWQPWCAATLHSPVWHESKFCGVALTSSPDRRQPDAAQSGPLAQPGDVLVVTMMDSLKRDCGAKSSPSRRCKGDCRTVTNGAVRDTSQIRDLGFSVFCAGISIKGTTKASRQNQHPITFDGVIVNPGDIVCWR